MNSGYDTKFRRDILMSVRNAYGKILKNHDSGVRPRHRDREFMKEERAKEKSEKRKNWYKKNNRFDSVMFVPITPGSEIYRRG